MRRIHLAIVAAAVVAAAAPASAQHAQARSHVTYAAMPNISRDSAAFARAQQLSERGDRRWQAYDLAGARRDFQQAVDVLRSRELYAGATLVSLANVTYATESPVKAAKVLVDAAEEAAAFGDLAVQVSATFEASLLYRDAGDIGQAARLLESTRKLLQSPYLPQDVKEKIERRIVE